MNQFKNKFHFIIILSILFLRIIICVELFWFIQKFLVISSFSLGD